MTATKWLARKSRNAIGDPSLLDLFAVIFIGWLIWPIPVLIGAVLIVLHLAAFFIDLLCVSVRTASRLPTALSQRRQTIVIKRPPPPPPKPKQIPTFNAPPPPTKDEVIDALKQKRKRESEWIELSGLPDEDKSALQNEADDRLRDQVREVLR